MANRGTAYLFLIVFVGTFGALIEGLARLVEGVKLRRLARAAPLDGYLNAIGPEEFRGLPAGGLNQGKRRQSQKNPANPVEKRLFSLFFSKILKKTTNIYPVRDAVTSERPEMCLSRAGTGV